MSEGTLAREDSDISFASELARKATHMGALIIPAGYWVLGLGKAEMLTIMIPIAALMFVIDVSRLRGWRFWTEIAEPIAGGMVRAHEKNGDFTGATYILTSVVCTVALFAKPVAVAALAFIIVGDTFAAVVGRRFGRLRFGRKSVEGSLACLAGTVLVALLAPQLALPVALMGAVVATVVEGLPLGIDDNISVPLVAGLAMSLFERLG